MAFTVTERGSGDASYSTSAAMGDAFTPAENDVIVVSILSASVTDPSSVTGSWSGSPTFTKIAESGVLHVYAWRVGASPGSGQVTVNYAASQTWQANVMQLAGASTASTVDTVFVQTQAININNPSSPAAFTTMSAFASATNMALNFGGMVFNTGSFTTPAGYTLILDSLVEDASPTFSLAGFYQASEDTTQTLESASFGYRQVYGLAFEIAEATSGASISTVPATVARGETVTITGTGFGASQGTGGVDFSTEACTIVSWSDTSIDVTVTSGTNLQYDATGYGFTVTADDASSDTSANVPFTPESGRSYIDLVSPVYSGDEYLAYGYEGTPAPVTTDQLEYPDATTPSAITFTTNADSEWILDSMPVVDQTVECQVIRAATGVRSASWTVTYQVAASTGLSWFDKNKTKQIGYITPNHKFNTRH